MKVQLMDINKFIEVNECPKIESPIMFDRGGFPDPDGLLSFEKFGISGSFDRKTIYGYIDLGKKFLHPIAYNALISSKRLFQAVIDGSGFFEINGKGELVENSTKGNNGIEWLYKNWDKLTFKKNGSPVRDQKISILNMDKNLLFIDKWLVIPAFYRDVDMSKKGRRAVDEINEYYVKLLNLASSGDTTFSYMGRITENRIQQQINEIYEYLTQSLAKKKGMIKKDLMGKTVDYATRGVLSAGRINSQSWKEQLIPFGYTAVPLSHLCNLFFPFFVYQMKGFFEEIFATTTTIKGRSGENIKLKDPMNDYTIEDIKKIIDLYITTPERRFEPLRVNTEKGFLKLNMFQNDLRRDFTITDLLYIVAERVCSDKHVYVTRYPVETFRLPVIY